MPGQREYWSNSELASDPSCENGVPEMAEYCEIVACNSARPQVDCCTGEKCDWHAPDTC
jgi:hypothetical protein